jgi:hypothetical protein
MVMETPGPTMAGMPDLTAPQTRDPTPAQVPDPTVRQTLFPTEGISMSPSPPDDFPIIAPEGMADGGSRGSAVTLGLAIALAVVAVLLVAAVILVIRVRSQQVHVHGTLAEPLDLSDGSDGLTLERQALLKLILDRERL